MRTYLSTSVQAGDTIANTAAQTAFATQLPVEPVYNTSPDLEYGRAYEIFACGYLSTLAAPGTLTLSVLQGSTSGNAVLGSTGAITPPASLVNAYWEVRGVAVYGVTGSTGKARFDGVATIQNASNVPFFAGMTAVGTGVVGQVAVNTSYLDGSLQVAATWATASATNTITLTQGLFKRVP